MRVQRRVISAILFLCSCSLWAQLPYELPAPVAGAESRVLPSASEAIARGDSLYRLYRFQSASDAYVEASGAFMNAPERRALERKMTLAQNALNMTEFCADVHVVASQRFSRKDFFLYYPLAQQGWHPSPNPLDSLGRGPLYYPKGADVIYFCATDRAGTRSIYVTENLDSLWRAPRLAGEEVLSSGNEIFPMLSRDGKTLYFASDGLFGMGGYDLYSSAWDPETGSWGAPVNMGFPFSSPADDFLLADSEDGQYTLFASNRDCAKDSVIVYVLDFEEQRKRSAIHDPAQLHRLCTLEPEVDPTRIDNTSAVEADIPSNANTRLYLRKMEEARALMDSVAVATRKGDTDRLLQLRQLLEEVTLELRLVENSFLESGVVTSAPDREVAAADQGYTFAKNAMGPRLRIKVGRSSHVPSFRIMPVGRFALDGTLPAGLVYQIEVFTSARHASLEDIKGLSPVYERLTPSLRYSYTVGTFSSYAAALTELNTVRVLGFPEARIVAWRDGRSIPVSLARREE